MLFYESQSLRSKLVYFIISLPILILLSVSLTTRLERWSVVILLIALLISCLVIFFILKIKLIIEENENGINVRVNYFFRQKISLHWNEIDSITIKKINPVKAFGGWGIRYTLKTTGFIFSGNTAVFIKTKTGRSYAFTIVRINDFYKMLTSKHGLPVLLQDISLT